ncbi:MAG: hypothetical protein Q7V63_04210 [Gammaproteobacteria bacterium]|nr:hypothetical protein [Gammaproteobacteria bacterium]
MQNNTTISILNQAFNSVKALENQASSFKLFEAITLYKLKEAVSSLINELHSR